MRKITDGYGNELDLNVIADTLFEYKPFQAAAKEIDPSWTRHHIHKEIQSGRVFLSTILTVYDDQLFTKFSQHKKMFLHQDEIKRIREDVATRPKRFHEKCKECNRNVSTCNRNPCRAKIVESPEYKDKLHEAAIRLAQHLASGANTGRRFSEYDRKGKPKVFANRK